MSMALVTLFVLLAALGVAHVGLLRAVSRIKADVEAVARHADEGYSFDDYEYDDGPIRSELAQLRLVVGEAVSQRERNDRRIEAVVRRAQKELRDAGLEHAGLEAEAHELRLLDPGGGEEVGVPPMHDTVERHPDDNEPSTVPGLTKGERRAMIARRDVG